ncbi:hypothetical protein F4808DRAFT_314827 [Astrocystis sublimbata]|nr:hypothetical protein F4808DRAFT_314827 [Astrocystis sublimbata]
MLFLLVWVCCRYAVSIGLRGGVWRRCTELSGYRGGQLSVCLIAQACPSSLAQKPRKVRHTRSSRDWYKSRKVQRKTETRQEI